jgi:hypothetical protein
MKSRRKNLHVVLEVGKKGLAGPILYRMEHRGQHRTRVIGRYYTADEVHAKFPCFRILRSYSVERTRRGE